MTDQAQEQESLERAFLATRKDLIDYATRWVGAQDAEDVVHDAYAEVAGLQYRPANSRAVLRIYTGWRVRDHLRARQEAFVVLESDLPEVEEDGELRTAELSDLESLSSVAGGPPAWPTAIDPVTPEHVATASELRGVIRDTVVNAFGDRAYAMFLAVMEDGLSQGRVAKEFGVDQATVSRTVASVHELLVQMDRDGAI